MTDIVERLRKASLSEHGLDIDKELLDYAATEIERLRREIEHWKNMVQQKGLKAIVLQ